MKKYYTKKIDELEQTKKKLKEQKKITQRHILEIEQQILSYKKQLIHVESKY